MKNALATALEPESPPDEQQTPESDVVEAPGDSPAQEQQVETEQKPDDKKTVVPHAALHEERERRKEIQRAFEEEKRQNAIFRDTMSRRMQELFQASQQSRQQPQQYRDPNADPDPVAALAHNQQLTVQQLAHLQQERQHQEQQRQHEEYQQRVISWAQSQADGFRKETPEFDDAYNHLRTVRVQELQAMGLPVEQIKRTLYNDEMWVYHHAAQAGKNPAEIAFNMAKAAGWKPKQQQQAADQKMDTLQKGTQAAKTLGNGGGDAGMPTLEQIAAMSEDDFATLKAKFAKQGKDIMEIVSR